MRSLLFSVTLLVSSCTSTSFQNFGAKIDDALQGNKTTSTSASRKIFALTVNVSPSDSIVKIMNIKPKYYDGIRLNSGSYDILVQRDGFESYRKWVNISGSDIVQNVELKPLLARTTSTSSPTTTQVSSSLKEQTSEVSTKLIREPVNKVVKNKPVALKPAVQAKPQPVEKVVDPKSKNLDQTLRSDYRPPELAIASQLVSAEMTKDEQPKFNGAYIKSVEEGFFSDTVQLIEMEQKPAYTAKIFRMKPKSSVSITSLLKQKKKYFALEDMKGTITLPAKQFQGIIFKGKNAEYVTLHRAERWVRSYDKLGGQSGEQATFFDSNQHVDEGQAVYTPMEDETVNKAKISDDSHFINFKQVPEKGLYICWVGHHFWFFNLI